MTSGMAHEKETDDSCIPSVSQRGKAFLFSPCSVRGYQGAAAEMKGNLMDNNMEQDTIRELSQRKQVNTH